MDPLQTILQKYRRVAVVGISANSSRPSHWIARDLQANGFEVIGVNPGLPKIPGIQVVATLQDVPGKLEIVDVFRSPDAIPALVEEAAAAADSLNQQADKMVQVVSSFKLADTGAGRMHAAPRRTPRSSSQP